MPAGYADYTVVDLLDAFASNEPVPGGGSAAALTGALAVSLLMMVAGLPKTKSGAPEEAADLAEAVTRLRPLREHFILLIDRDSEVYRGVLAAYRQPRSTPAEQDARRAAIQAAVHDATEVPLEAMRACQQALAGAVVVAKNGLRSATSDVGTAVELLLASMRACGLAVDTNLTGLTDQDYRRRVTTERQQLEADSVADATHARRLL